MIRIATRLMLPLLLWAAPVLADEDCAVPMTDWQPREAVMRLASDLGWDLRRIRIDDGCYEVFARDAQGRSIEVKLDPATLAVIEMEFEEPGHDEDGEHHDGQDREED